MNISNTCDDSILTVTNLTVDFPENPRVLNGVNLTLKRGEILGLVGGSGSGKSLFARTLLRLESPACLECTLLHRHGTFK